VPQPKEVNNADISGLVTGQWGQYFVRGRAFSGGAEVEIKAIFSYMSSKASVQLAAGGCSPC
jgi:hypothetical protein